MTALKQLRAKQAAVDLTGKNAVVVGGTSGIGEGIALRLAQAKATVFIVGRNETRGQEIVAEMKSRGASAESGFVKCDAFLLASVKKAAEKITELLPRQTLDILVLVAGIGTMQGRTETSEGLDQKLAIHYYSRMAFAEALAPVLKKSSDARVMTVLSGGVHSPYAQYKEDPEVKNYSLKKAADAAGFYNDLAVDWMSERHAPVKFIHASPGVVNTNVGGDLPWGIRGMWRVMLKVVGRDPAECAEFMCSALFRPSGELFAERNFFIMGKDGEKEKVTSLHTPEARAFMQAHTLEILEKLMK